MTLVPGRRTGTHSQLELDDDEMRSMVRVSLERILDHLRGMSKSPAADTSRGASVARSLIEPAPEEGVPFETLLARLFDDVIPTSVNTAGPGYLAYIPGGGVFHSALADFIAKSVNRYVGYWYMAPAIVQIEWTVIRWFCEIVGYGPETGGVLTSGGSMASLTALIAARTTRLPEDFRNGVVYVTSQTHYSIAKAVLLAGFPARCLRTIDVDATFRMDAGALRAAVAADRAAGLTPFMVVGSAGTTNTGAVDPLDDLADVADREGMWLHVDGAYGAFFVLTETGRKALRGIERADSITLDPHKALCMPYGTGALLVRDMASLKDTFGARAEYLPPMNDVEGEVDFCGLSPELSRDWRGLRLWLPLKMHGLGPFRENLEEKLVLAREAEQALRAIPHVEMVASPQLTVLAFRLNPHDRSEEALDALNHQLLEGITRRQRILLSPTRLDGRFALRVALLSFRTHAERMREGLADIREAVHEILAAEGAPEVVHGRFERQARQTPLRTALIAGQRTVTFAELDAAADRVAAALCARGLREGGHVGIYIARSVEAIVAMLGVLKAGAVYVPIDPNDPGDRQRFIIDDAEIDLLVCVDASSKHSPRGLVDEARIVELDAIDRARAHVPSPRESTRELVSEPETGDRPMYLLYTSGSTGRPKGVIGLHGATLNRLSWMWNELPFAPGEVCLHRTTLHFVDAVAEIFGPLLQGIPVAVLPAESTGDPDAIAEAIRRHEVSRVTAVPTILDALLKRVRGGEGLSTARIWISSGERLQASLLARFRAGLPDATLLNLYGSTEGTGDVTCATFAPGSPLPASDVPIGRPITNARLLVLDEHGVPVPDGEEGELYIGGPVLARGYHRRPEEHAARFVSIPLLFEGPAFRTGDRVMRDREGVFHYVGRNDRQVKVRGVRVELDEVEAALLECAGPAVVGAVVARQGSDAERGHRIAAFVAPKTADVGALTRKLAARLPASMLPATIVALDALPLLPNGKVDRQALQLPELETTRTAPGGNALEELILALWAERLPARPTSTESDFHRLGGDSLDLVDVLTDLGTIMGRAVPIGDVPHPLTVSAMARMLEGAGPASGNLAVEGLEIVPLTASLLEATRPLLVEAFSLREPMAVALGAEPSDLAPFAQALLARCTSEPMSFVAVEKSTGRVVGFCLGHDHAGAALAFDAKRESPRVAPLFALLGELQDRYVAEGRPNAGQVFEIAATGAATDVDGYAVARALEQRVFAEAKAQGFERAMTLCTNAVTRYLAEAEQGMRIVQEMKYESFEHEGRAVFAPAAKHRGVALLEKRLR